MKNQIKIPPTFRFCMLLLASFLIFVFPACDDPVENSETHLIKSEPSFKAGPEGGTFQALDGNVTLTIPETALDEQVKFTIKEGPVDEYEEFVIKSIEINPTYALFKKPVSLNLKYNGSLSCGLDPCKATCLVLYKFKNDMEFDKRNYSKLMWTEKCTLNTMNCSIETEIISGGVYAIGEESLSQANN